MTVATKTNLLYGHDDYVSAWVEERMPDMPSSGFKKGRAIGVLSADSTRLICGVTYFDYDKDCKTMQLAFAADSPMWAKQETIKELLSYPFMELGIFKCWVTIASDNDRSIKTVKHIGFKQEAILGHHFGKKKHAVILRMFYPDFVRLYG